jgi:N-acetylglucosamine-6-phosphate deacetylase
MLMPKPDPPGTFSTTGLCDLQVNGFAGVDYNDPSITPVDIEQSLLAMLATGVTQCLPTIITATLDWQRGCLRALEAARTSALCEHMMIGYHLEGPFLNPTPGYCGCHPAAAMVAASWEYFEQVQEAAGGHIRLITVAPERPGVMALIPRWVEAGVTVAIGHSAADYETLRAAVDVGASLSTHLGNGTAATVPKSDNVVLSQLAIDELSASFIADGYHVRRHVLGVYLRAKQAARTILVTDGTAGSAAAPGHYTLGRLAIERDLEPVVHEAGTQKLAGSGATLDDCVRHVVDWYDIDPLTAIGWAGDKARDALGLDRSLYSNRAAGCVTWRHSENGPGVTRVQLGKHDLHP